MMRYVSFAVGVFLLLEIQAAELKIDNGVIETVFVSPQGPPMELGSRFIRAGWLRSSHRHGSGKNFFRTETLFDDHPAFGCPQEILPALKLDGDRRLKIGVGIIGPDRVKPNWPELRISFPWQISILRLPSETQINYRQTSGEHCGYAYELTMEIVIPENQPEIRYCLTLRNCGERTISFSTYVHPFFPIPENPETCWYCISESSSEKRSRLLHSPEIQIISKDRLAEGCHKVEAGGFPESDDRVSIASDTPLMKTVFYRRKFLCFSVEPFVQRKIEPGQKTSWKWILTFQKNS